MTPKTSYSLKVTQISVQNTKCTSDNKPRPFADKDLDGYDAFGTEFLMSFLWNQIA